LARWQKGYAVLFRNAVLAKDPVIIVSQGGCRGYIGHHILVALGRASSATVVFYDIMPENATGGKSFVAEIYLEPASRLRLYTILIHKKPGFHAKKIYMGHGSVLEESSLIMGGEMTHYRDEIILAGERAEANVRIGLIGFKETRADANTIIEHREPETRSRVRAQGIAAGKSWVVYEGVARVLEKAVDSATSIDARMLLTSREASAHASPKLEVLTGRVKEARHSAAISDIGTDQLFYLMTRGLSEEEARILLVRGILEETIGLKPPSCIEKAASFMAKTLLAG